MGVCHRRRSQNRDGRHVTTRAAMVDVNDPDITGTRGVSPRYDANWNDFADRLHARYNVPKEALEQHATARGELVEWLDETLDEPRMRITKAIDEASEQSGFRWGHPAEER